MQPTHRPGRRTTASLVLSACCLAGLASALVTPAAADAPSRLHIVPGGSGDESGRSWADAGDLEDLPRLVAEVEDGGEVWVRADAGAYRSTETLQIRSGGRDGAPVTVRGVDREGQPARATVVGTRTAPYDIAGDAGIELVKLRDGAESLVFSDLDVRDVGVAFSAAGAVRDLEVRDVSASNVRKFLQNSEAPGESTPSISDVQLRRIDVQGFSRNVVQLQYDSHDVLIEDVVGDSQQQDGDDFAMGVHLYGTVHDVTVRRVTMRNSLDTVHDYWNGDGFTTENDVRDVRFEDTVATGSSDAGYDIKSRDTTLVRAQASGNKRNFRFWAGDTAVQDCTATDPVKRGGSGSQAQVWLASGAGVRMTGCTVTDADADTNVFELEDGSDLRVEGGRVSRSADAALRQVERGSTLRFDGTELTTVG